MGQKVNPLGFRVGITKKHQSQWFARFNKNKYAQSVLEDRMLRQTLTNLFPELLNPLLKKVVKKEDDTTVTPKITQIHIERGLIPYEIGIGIYAENCELLKSAIDNLKVNRDLACKLQKARRYLLNLRTKFNLAATTEASTNDSNQSSTNTLSSETKTNQRKNFNFKARLTKREQRRQRLIKKRLRKRQSIRRRYRQLISSSLFIKKTGTKVIQKLSLKSKKGGKFVSASRNPKAKKTNSVSMAKMNQRLAPKAVPVGKTRTSLSSANLAMSKQKGASSTLNSRIKKKFVSIYIQKMNKKFLQHLKLTLSTWTNKLQNTTYAPLGYNKEWSLTRLNVLKKQPIPKLQRLIRVLEQKSLVKLEALRKEFIAFGSISTEKSFAYYQIVNFLKHLKELVNKLKREQKLQLILNKVNKSSIATNETSSNLESSLLLPATSSLSTTKSLTATVLRTKLNNIDDECRKIKFIEYLKDLVKKHRTKNIYLYLATIADARKDLRKLKQFTKRHANFLFGLNPASLTENTAKLQEKVQTRVNQQLLRQVALKNEYQRTLQDIFNEQIEKQRTMYTENAQLTPKITLKFYSVNSQTLQSKASIVADSVVDALEKRKAFRKVIKDSKESLMRTPGVKGVKIQVAGRLNGAEIARTEWVRAGRVPLQTLRANLDYSYKTANTIYGIIGIKVWIFKGYTKIIN